MSQAQRSVAEPQIKVASGLKLPSKEEFLKLAAHIHTLSGIHLPLSDKNLVLISGRLQKLQRNGLCVSFRELIEALERKDAKVIDAFVSALTTNTTSFFRERDHFQLLQAALPGMAASRPKGEPIRIWCTPCSSGEEAYSIAITAAEAFGGEAKNVQILATDISERVLRLARAGNYPAERLSEIPPALAERYFSIGRNGEGGSRRAQVSAQLRERIRFGRFNLLLDYPFEHKFDVIFCRNVLIYFERHDAEYVVTHLRDQLRPGGQLFLGHSETAAGVVQGLRRAGPATFIRE